MRTYKSIILFLTLLLLCGCSFIDVTKEETVALDNWTTMVNSVPDYDGEAYCVINNNTPAFNIDDYPETSFEFYSELDSLGRCGTCIACIGEDIMPTEERGEIGQIKPTGWHTIRYDFIEKRYLYNRCHLIGYQLTGENDNVKNLITGTRYLNTEGMLPFENEVAKYITTTGNHVLYRVVPIFDGDNLLASGLTIEAKSVEDDGQGVQFYVYCYNVQPGVEIDYATGESYESSSSILTRNASSTYSDTEPETVETETSVLISEGTDYILNTRSMKFHLTTCNSVQEMSEKNRQEYQGTREKLILEGYSPCGACKP